MTSRKNHPSQGSGKSYQEIDTGNDEESIFYGRHVVRQILKDQKQLNRLFVQKDLQHGDIQSILKLARQAGVVVQEVPKTKLDELSDQANHQGVVATLPPYPYQTLEDCLDLAKEREEDPFLLILDGIEDPHNLGSILRSAEACGVHGVIIPERRSASLTGVVAKTSAGAIERVPVVRVVNIVRTIEALKDQGLWLFATDSQGEDMRTWNHEGPLALIIGNEGKGVAPTTLKASDGTVSVPMTGQIESLNASVAAAVLMYEVARTRLPFHE